MNWLEGMQNEGYEWDALCIQEIAMRNHEEMWKYDMSIYGDMLFFWSEIAPWDSVIIIGKELATRMTRTSTRSKRHTVLVAGSIDGVTIIISNVDMPTNWPRRSA